MHSGLNDLCVLTSAYLQTVHGRVHPMIGNLHSKYTHSRAYIHFAFRHVLIHSVRSAHTRASDTSLRCVYRSDWRQPDRPRTNTHWWQGRMSPLSRLLRHEASTSEPHQDETLQVRRLELASYARFPVDIRSPIHSPSLPVYFLWEAVLSQRQPDRALTDAHWWQVEVSPLPRLLRHEARPSEPHQDKTWQVRWLDCADEQYLRAWSIWIYRLCRKKSTLCQSDRFVSSYSRRPSTVFREGRWKTVEVCVELTFQNGSQNKRSSDMHRQML